MTTTVLLLGAVVAGWVVQTLLTYRQSMAFRRQAAALRQRGTVSVGAGGRRYRGGRAFVALAVDESGRVRDAIVLRGWTTFSRARPLPAVVGQRAGKLTGAAEVPGLETNEREACREAATLLGASAAASAEERRRP